jgi:hypothetical protein
MVDGVDCIVPVRRPAIRVAASFPCRVCSGSGSVRKVRPGFLSDLAAFEAYCVDCAGTGFAFPNIPIGFGLGRREVGSRA